MALTAFTSRLGRGQGRLLTSRATGGDYAFVLGEDEPGASSSSVSATTRR